MLSYLEAARVPESLPRGTFGDWVIKDCKLPEYRRECGRDSYTVLMKKIQLEPTWENIHRLDDDCMTWDLVMEDSPKELKRHLPIWLKAKGSVLKTGLGLGCVVRGLLANPKVEHIDVVEIDEDIIRVVGAEFKTNPKVAIHHGDALHFEPTNNYDFIWHDVWLPENNGLTELHAKLILKFKDYAGKQGAWAFPRCFKRQLSLIG